MRVNDLIAENDVINEAPVGMLKKAGQAIGAKALGAIGAKGKAGNLASKADLSDTANNLYNEFRKYLGTQDKDIKTATGEDLDGFLKSKGATVPGIPSGVINKQQINKAVMQAAKDAMAAQAGVQKAAPGQEQPGAAGDIKFAPNQQVQFTGKDGQEKDAKVIGKGKTDDVVTVQLPDGQKAQVRRDQLVNPQTDKPFQPGDKPATAPKAAKISPKLQQKINALAPDQKKQLADML